MINVNIKKYRAFLKTVECGSFTRAAEMLNYSQSGISRMIQDLEKEWNVSLLERGKAGIRLTSDGIKILPYAKRICDDYDKLQIQIDELNGLQTGIIRIGTFSSVATHWLPNIILEFQKDYPNVDYELLLGDDKEIENWIMEGRVDFGFLRLPTLPELDTVFLEKDPMMVVFRRHMCLQKLKKFRWKRWKNLLLCYWKKEIRQKSQNFLKDMVLRRIFISQRGMIMQLCLWWNTG